jgi:hypothetical protein
MTHPSSPSSPIPPGIVTASTSGRQRPALSIHSPIVCFASSMFNPMMTSAVVHERTLTHPRFANDPMRFRSLVNWISGTIANGSCRLRTAWLNSSSPNVAPGPTM